MSLLEKARYYASEMIIPIWEPISWSGLRSNFRAVSQRFWPRHPIYEGTIVNYELARQLYRNDGDKALGSGFCKPIVDLQVAFIGVPTASTDDEGESEFLNECLHNYWVDEIQQIFRDTLRDSRVIVRIRRPDILDPLMTLEEAEHCELELYPPERVEIERNFRNKRIIDRVVVQHRLVLVKDEGNPREGRDPQTEEIDALEIITPENIRWWNKTNMEPIPQLNSDNRYGFVNFLEVHNEWDASLQGGMSEFETVIPFVNALHDVLHQGLEAHAYHSTPKVKFKLQEILPFLKNNFADAIDETTGQIKERAEISWNGREVFFLKAEEDIGFVEAQSVLGDTKTLAEFLIDCICIASQTPEWAFMRVDSGSANSDRNAQTVPFVKKIARKRNNFTKAIQDLCKMALLIQGGIPVRAKLAWEAIRPDDEAVTMQAFQQLVMGLEVAAQRGEISDATYREMIRQFLPVMKSPSAEEKDAKKDQADRLALMPALPESGNVPITSGPQGENE